MGATTVKEAWNTLKEGFQGNAKTKYLTSLSMTKLMGSLEAYEKRLIYNPRTKKFMISRDVEFDESESWNWEEEKVERKSVTITQPCREGTEETASTTPLPTTPPSIRHEGSLEPRTRSLQDMYETCNFITIEPESFEVAIKEEILRKAMEEEIKTIEKNKTWELIDHPQDKRSLGLNGSIRPNLILMGQYKNIRQG
ncbi:unnamed protein product [Prunus brigantina]